MNEIICPNCKKGFKVDEAGFGVDITVVTKLKKNKKIMEIFELDSKNNQIVFEMNSHESRVFIKRVSFKLNENIGNDWRNIISSLQLSYKLQYIVYKDNLGRFEDNRTTKSILRFPIDIYQKQPVFDLNKEIKNDRFTIDLNPELKSYTTLKIELKETKPITEEYVLLFEIEKYNSTV